MRGRISDGKSSIYYRWNRWTHLSCLINCKKVRKKGIDTLFIGTKHRMEKDIVPKENFRFIGLDVLPLRSIKSVFKMMKATMDTIKLLKKEKPTKIIAFGNYITIPVLVAANVLRIPYYLQEQNHTMGQANKWFYKGAKSICRF